MMAEFLEDIQIYIYIYIYVSLAALSFPWMFNVLYPSHLYFQEKQAWHHLFWCDK